MEPGQSVVGVNWAAGVLDDVVVPDDTGVEDALVGELDGDVDELDGDVDEVDPSGEGLNQELLEIESSVFGWALLETVEGPYTYWPLERHQGAFVHQWFLQLLLRQHHRLQ